MKHPRFRSPTFRQRGRAAANRPGVGRLGWSAPTRSAAVARRNRFSLPDCPLPHAPHLPWQGPFPAGRRQKLPCYSRTVAARQRGTYHGEPPNLPLKGAGNPQVLHGNPRVQQGGGQQNAFQAVPYVPHFAADPSPLRHDRGRSKEDETGPARPIVFFVPSVVSARSGPALGGEPGYGWSPPMGWKRVSSPKTDELSDRGNFGKEVEHIPHAGRRIRDRPVETETTDRLRTS